MLIYAGNKNRVFTKYRDRLFKNIRRAIKNAN